MRGGAETIKSDTARIACSDKRAVADESRAKERSGRSVVIRIRNGQAIACVCDEVLGVPTVDVVAGESRVCAQVLLAAKTVFASAARVAQPRNAYTIAGAIAAYVAACRDDGAHDFVTWNDRKLAGCEITIYDV
jgi:hypothetical protein